MLFRSNLSMQLSQQYSSEESLSLTPGKPNCSKPKVCRYLFVYINFEMLMYEFAAVGIFVQYFCFEVSYCVNVSQMYWLNYHNLFLMVILNVEMTIC